ncbi:glycerophosphodiester phosphodiesterase [Pseudoxanthomonas wuyuanensis]|nr:glycerophosphodiester phosphodiesterase [Pseudoxanthomonas wuyuanensis]KAF1721863.1 glycerophosphodiester phosphodiesterase [Pseudoxanthomonas wuyuanensis]
MAMPIAADTVHPSAQPQVLVIAHRGASALRPEHTLAAYLQAIEDGADYIEPDLVSTRDGVLVARHENEIGGTTDVAQHPEFAGRRRSATIDGKTQEGWFSEDFTLAELKTLRARERLPQLRSTAYDGRFEIPTLAEIIRLLADESARRGRVIGLIPEIKHSTHFRQLGLAMEDRLLQELAAHDYTRRAPVVLQSFESGNLRYLHERMADAHSNIRLLQLIDEPGGKPADAMDDSDAPSYGQMLTPAGLQRIAGYASIIGPDARLVIPLDGEGRLGAPTDLVRDAHAAGLQVMAYTFRPEQAFLPRALWTDDKPATRNPAASIAEIRAYVAAGIDGFFTDDPALGRRAVSP